MTNILDQTELFKKTGLRKNISLLIQTASETPDENNYSLISQEFTAFYTTQLKGKSFPPILRFNIPAIGTEVSAGLAEDSRRVVIIGDLHSDFNSLSSILSKLALSSYDYFEKALFIFMGDYTDRGRRPIETLRLLYALKTYLGERCILLKGNHELFSFCNGKLQPLIYPADTYRFFNIYLSMDVNRLHSAYCDLLPYAAVINHYASVETPTDACRLLPVASFKRYLVCHASIPRYDYISYFDEEKLAWMTMPFDRHSDLATATGQMVWGDPSEDVDPMWKDEVRFEFGRTEFFDFMNKNGYDLLIRGHERVEDGVKHSFDGRIITIFSTGGRDNDDSFYSLEVPDPSFAIIMEDGLIVFERVFDSSLETHNKEV